MIQTLRRTKWSATREQLLGRSDRRAREPPLQLGHPLPLGLISVSVAGPLQDLVDELVADLVLQHHEQPARQGEELVGGEPHAEAELGVVLEERVGPGWTTAFAVHRPRRGGQVAAVDRRAARGVGDEQPVAEELGEQLDVGRLAAAGAGARELEQRLEELHAAHRREVHPRTVVDRQRLEEAEVLVLRLLDRLLGAHVDGLLAGLLLALCRACLDAQRAAGAVVDRDL